MYALPLTSFPTDNIRQHALHTRVFNCLLGFCVLTHNLCSQLLVSHFSFVPSFIEMCCFALAHQRVRRAPSALCTQMFMCQSIMLISVLSQWNWMSDEWIVLMVLRVYSEDYMTQSFIVSTKPPIMTLFQNSLCILGKKKGNAPPLEVIFVHISFIVSICMAILKSQKLPNYTWQGETIQHY